VDYIIYEVGAKIPIALNLGYKHIGVQTFEDYTTAMRGYFNDYDRNYVNHGENYKMANIGIIHSKPKKDIQLNNFNLIISSIPINKLENKKIIINLQDYGIPIDKVITLHLYSDVELALKKEPVISIKEHIENVIDEGSHWFTRKWLYEKDKTGKYAFLSGIDNSKIHSINGVLYQIDEETKIQQEDGKFRLLMPQELASMYGYSYLEYRKLITPYLKRSKVKTLDNKFIFDLFNTAVPKKIASSIISSYIDKKHQL